VDADRNLLFGVLALQIDLLDAEQFVRACALWTARKQTALADLLIELGWITAADKADVERLLERKLKKHAGNARAGLAAVSDEVKRSLATLGDPDVERSLAGLPGAEITAPAATIDYRPAPGPRYARTRLHATGGIGRVWLAHDSELGRHVALKELRPEKAGDAVLRGRFLKEARITGQLEHPGVVPVYELARRPDDQQPFYTMRYVHGHTLTQAARAYHQKRREGRADSLEFVALLNAFVVVCNTIAYAHSRGVIHRDLKGQNVVLGEFGEVVVLDWGLAKVVNRPDPDAEMPPILLDSDRSAAPDLTAEGQTVGTPAYMAPEQAAGQLDLIDRRTDVYGLGAMLYEILTGQPPFLGANTLEVLRKVREEEPTPPRSVWSDVPPALEAVCLRALAKRPADRPAGADNLAQEVQGWQEFERRQAEDALRRQTEILQSVLNSMSDGVIVADETGKFILWNPAAERIVGRPEQNVPPSEWSERYGCYLPDTVTLYPAEQLPMERAIRGEEVDEAELFLRRETRPEGLVMSINARPLKDKQGILRGGVIVFRDVTARKKVEEELRKSQERFELAVQGSQDGLWDWDLTTDEVYYSPRYKAMLGYEDHEFPNRSEEWAKRVHPEDLERVRGELRAHFKGRESLSWVEFRMRHKDGSYRWIRSRAFVLRDATGRVYRMAGSHEDVTERKAAEEELARERHLLRTFLDVLPEGIYFKDRDSRLIRANRTVAETVGCAPAQLVGKTDFDFFAPEVARQSFEDEQEIIRTGRPIIAKEEKVTWRDGLTLWVSTTKMPLRDPDGHIIGTFGITRDVTKRNLAEEALRESEERYRAVIAAMQDGIVLMDADGSIRDCNASAERILGLSADQLMGRTPHDPRWRAIHEDGSPFPGEMHPPMVTLRTGQPCTDVVMGVHKPDGTLTWITVNAQPLYRADGKTLCGVVASFEDVTDRRRMEEALDRVK
jgi:PAS domain S-box-containing protein